MIRLAFGSASAGSLSCSGSGACGFGPRGLWRDRAEQATTNNRHERGFVRAANTKVFTR